MWLAASLTSHRQLRESTFHLSVNMNKQLVCFFSPRTNRELKQILETGERIHFHFCIETHVSDEPGKSGVNMRERALEA